MTQKPDTPQAFAGINQHAVMVPIEQCCNQVMRKRSRCSLKAQENGFCHQHKDRTLYALVSYDTGIAKRHINDVVESLVSHMGWEQVKAFQNEMRRGQLYEDAGGYFIYRVSSALGIPENQTAEKMQRLLKQHAEEWKSFVYSLGSQSFIADWAINI